MFCDPRVPCRVVACREVLIPQASDEGVDEELDSLDCSHVYLLGESLHFWVEESMVGGLKGLGETKKSKTQNPKPKPYYFSFSSFWIFGFWISGFFPPLHLDFGSWILDFASPTYTINAAISSATMLRILIIGLIAGPAVSLYGSPTVSPVTAAL